MKINNYIYNVYSCASSTLSLVFCFGMILGFSSCTQEDESSFDSDVHTPLNIRAGTPLGFGTLANDQQRSTRAFNSTSKLSELMIYYYTATDNLLTSYKVIERNITQEDDNDTEFSFHTLANDGANGSLFWQSIQGKGKTNTRLFLEVTKQVSIGEIEGESASLWGTMSYEPSTTEPVVNHNTALDFGKLHYRKAALTVVVKSHIDGASTLDTKKLEVTLESYNSKTQDDRLAQIADFNSPTQVTLITPHTSSSMETQISGSALVACYLPGNNTNNDKDKYISVWYGVKNEPDTRKQFKLDLSTLTVNRELTSPFHKDNSTAWPYNANAFLNNSGYASLAKEYYGLQRFNNNTTQLAFNPGEHLTLTITLTVGIDTELEGITVKAFTQGAEEELEVPQQ